MRIAAVAVPADQRGLGLAGVGLAAAAACAMAAVHRDVDQRPLAVPGAPALLGAQVVLQAVFAAPSRLELPPGVLLRLGR